MKNRVLNQANVANLKKAVNMGSDCEMVLPSMTYNEILRGGGIEIELEEQFETVGDLSLSGYELFSKYFPEHVERFKRS